MEIRRGDQTLAKELELVSLPEEVPAELPAPHGPVETKGAEPAVGVVSLETEGCWAYVPTNYQSELRYGVVIWLHGPDAEKQDDLVARWKARCEAHDLILLVPKSADPVKWQGSDVRTVMTALDELAKGYGLDPARVVVHGFQQGGSMAYLVGFAHADRIHGIAVVGAPLPAWLTLPENDPLNRMAIYSAAGRDARSAAVDTGLERLRGMKYPVTRKMLGDEPRYLVDNELDEMIRWIDTLDRF